MSISTIKKEAKYFAEAALDGAANSKVLKYGAGPLAFLCGGAGVAFAASDTLTKNLKAAMKKIYGFILGISTALAVLIIAWNILKYMAATDPQTAMQAKKSAIHVAIAWVILNSMGGIITLLTSLGGDDGQNSNVWN